MRTWIFFLILSVCFGLTGFTNASERPLDWKLSTEKAGIRIFTAEREGDPILYLKGIADLQAPFTKVASVILNPPRAPEWIADLEESKILQWTQEHREYIEYNHIGTPFILKDREFVSVVRITAGKEPLDDPTGQKTQAMIRIDYSDVPASLAGLAPETDRVRGSLGGTYFILRDHGENASQIEGVLHCDPKGSVPKWIVNWFQKSWPLNTFRGIQRQLKKPDVTELSFLKTLLSTPQ